MQKTAKSWESMLKPEKILKCVVKVGKFGKSLGSSEHALYAD
jgi:hypothetical protein